MQGSDASVENTTTQVRFGCTTAGMGTVRWFDAGSDSAHFTVEGSKREMPAAAASAISAAQAGKRREQGEANMWWRRRSRPRVLAEFDSWRIAAKGNAPWRCADANEPRL
jgi:hypothetical protein